MPPYSSRWAFRPSIVRFSAAPGNPKATPSRDFLDGLPPNEQMTMLGYVNPPGYASMGVVNTRAWRQCEVPSTNGHGNARAVARLYGALATDGEHIVAFLVSRAVVVVVE